MLYFPTSWQPPIGWARGIWYVFVVLVLYPLFFAAIFSVIMGIVWVLGQVAR